MLTFGLATWRVAKLLTWETGPWKIFVWVRERTGIVHDEEGHPSIIPDNAMAGILSCVWCCSIWVAGTLIVVWYIAPLLILGIASLLATSTIAIMVERGIG